jgi:hypothetical protein
MKRKSLDVTVSVKVEEIVKYVLFFLLALRAL